MLEGLKIMKQTSGSDIEALRALKLCSGNILAQMSIRRSHISLQDDHNDDN